MSSVTQSDIQQTTEGERVSLSAGTSLLTIATQRSQNPFELQPPFGRRFGPSGGALAADRDEGFRALYCSSDLNAIVGEILLSRRNELESRNRTLSPARIESLYLVKLELRVNLQLLAVPASVLSDGPILIELDGDSYAPCQEYARQLRSSVNSRPAVAGLSWHSTRTGSQACVAVFDDWLKRTIDPIKVMSSRSLSSRDVNDSVRRAIRWHGFSTKHRPR